MLRSIGLLVLAAILGGLFALILRDSEPLEAQEDNQHWQYITISIGHGADPGTTLFYIHGISAQDDAQDDGVVVEPLAAVVTRLLNDFGSEGWELVTVSGDESGFGGTWNYYLRRPLQ